MNIPLSKPTKLVVQEEKAQTVEAVALREYKDNATTVEVLIAFGDVGPDQPTKTVTISGDAYAAIADKLRETREAVAKAISEIL